jgi:hypothetical protein
MENQRSVSSRRRNHLPPIQIWMVAGSLAIACILMTMTWGILKLGGSKDPSSLPTAILEIKPAIVNTPSLTPDPGAVPSGSETALPVPPPGEMAIGAYVQVTGTGGDGLRLRDQPGLNSNVLMVASEAEVFRVVDGPVVSDEYSWWHLQGPFDETRHGWAVVSYLEIVQNP